MNTSTRSTISALLIAFTVSIFGSNLSQPATVSAQDNPIDAGIKACGAGVHNEVVTACVTPVYSTQTICYTFLGLPPAQQIQAAVNFVAGTATGGTVNVPGGTYTFASPLLIPNGQPVFLRGNGSEVGHGLSPLPTVLTTSTAGMEAVVTTDFGVSNFLVMDLAINGGDNADHGLLLNYNQGSAATCIGVEKNNEEGVEFSGNMASHLSDSWIRHGTFYPAVFETGSGNQIIGNTIDATTSTPSSSGIEAAGSGSLVANNTITGFGNGIDILLDTGEVRENLLKSILVAGISASFFSTDVAITHNVIEEGCIFGISADGDSHEIGWNYIERCTRGIEVRGDLMEVKYNNIVQPTEDGIYVDNANHNDFFVNQVATAGDNGITVTGDSSDNTFLSNTLHGSTNEAVNIEAGDTTTVDSNTITCNGDSATPAVRVNPAPASSVNTITSNTISHAFVSPVVAAPPALAVIQADPQENTIASNTVSTCQ